jgi:hypothetical protein
MHVYVQLPTAVLIAKQQLATNRTNIHPQPIFVHLLLQDAKQDSGIKADPLLNPLLYDNSRLAATF